MADIAPTTVNGTPPRRQANAAYRQREYLTEKEVEQLIEAARKRGRNSARDAAAILLAYKPSMVPQANDLQW
jgi:type 1 fimbriae regulatory protein FimE